MVDSLGFFFVLSSLELELRRHLSGIANDCRRREKGSGKVCSV